jgi:hypothetical protein
MPEFSDFCYYRFRNPMPSLSVQSIRRPPATLLSFSWVLFALAACGESSGNGAPKNVAGATSGAPSSSGGSAGANSNGGSATASAGATGGSVAGASNTGGAAGTGTAGTGTAGTGTAGTGTAGQAGAMGNAGAPGLASCAQMVSAASAFLATLGQGSALRDLAAMDFEERIHFKFTPGVRPGVPLRDLSDAQRALALALVATGLSEDGFTKAEITRQNELVLRAQENSDARDPLGYFLTIYGTPAKDGTWAWQWEGHHLSLHFTLANCKRAATAPTFYGANPARVATSVTGGPPMGTRNLGQEEDLARQLAGVLDMDAAKRAQAIVPDQLRDTPETTSVMAVQPRGLLASGMSRAEQDMLRVLIAEYANNLAAELAAERLSRIEDAGLDGVSFLWSGSLAPGQAHYYRVQGPTFLIEYANEQNNANHVHAAWRDFNGDYGRDLIAEHRLTHRH